MFPAACYQVVKTAGRNTLLPVASLDEMNNVVPLQLVVKKTKRRFIFFEKAYYTPSEFKLNDVLIDQRPLDFPCSQECFLTDYGRITQLSMKGKFGAELCEEIMDVELETDDSISLSIKFGKLNKSEAEVDKLIPILQRRRINMDHPYIKEIRKDKKNVLCLITGVISLDAGGTISRVSDYKGSVGGKSNTLSASAGVDLKGDRELGLRAGTPVAYSIHELNIGTVQGELTLVLTKGEHGGFAKSVGYDEVDATPGTRTVPGHSELGLKKLEEDLYRPKKDLRAILSLPPVDRQQFRDLILQLLTSSRDFPVLNTLIDEVVEGRYSQPLVSDLEKKLVSPKETWLKLLEMVGFSPDATGRLCPPTEVNEMVSGVEELFDALTCLDDEELEMIRQCSPAVVPNLLLVLKDGLRGLPVPVEKVPELMREDSGKKLLLQLAFSVGSETCTPPTPLHCSTDETYWTLMALWGEQ